MSNKITYTNISKLYSLAGGIRTHEHLDDPKIIEHAYLTIENEKIMAIGTMEEYFSNGEEVFDCHGQIMLPGFIDAHSHLVFAGDRTHEYAMKIKGASYLDIYQAGGGIHSTVEATQKASFDELLAQAKDTIHEFLSCGVTTLEAKSGYGLNRESELKQLRVVKQLNVETPMELVSTFMPAHALPKHFLNSKDFLDEMIQDVLPAVLEENLAEYMDCFLEKGIFDANEAKYILQAGKDAGLKIKIHIDEIEDIGGSDVAVELQATSVEHCMVTTPQSMEKLQNANVTAVILPATSFNLCKPYADVKKMIEKGMVIALSCDYNPGSSPCSDPLWMARIASRGCHLTPNEVLSMMTINAAKAIDRESMIGSLEIGKQADFNLMDVPSFDDVIAKMGANPITRVVKKGQVVVDVRRTND